MEWCELGHEAQFTSTNALRERVGLAGNKRPKEAMP